MLGIHSSFPEDSSSRMPMDLSQYLLSASPPSSAFDLLSFSSQQAFSQFRNKVPFDNTTYSAPSSSYTALSSAFTAPPSFQCLQMAQIGKKDHLKGSKNSPLKSIIVKSEFSYSSDSDGDSGSENSLSPRRSNKKVSFADHQGLALAEVRLVKEGPDEPPRLNPDLISSLTNGTNADVTLNPPIRICFSQPASDYMAFREKLNKDKVSLENVILRDYTVEGTIKVKNVSFEKKVFVRVSLDEWDSFEDTVATYVPGPGVNNNYSDPFDTFCFSLDISPSFDVTKKVQFAVCFEENGNEHWDNYGGLNYVIVSENYQENQHAPNYSERFLPTKRREESWSEFCVWREEKNTPYY